MKTLISLFVLAAGSAAALSAQSVRPLTATIPFAFYVGDTQMPAGEYRVALPAGVLAIKVQSPDGSNSAMRLVNAASATRTPANHALVFRKYGEDRYFLGGIWHLGEPEGLEVPKSKKEREAVTSTLVSASRPTTVVILARVR